MNYSVIRYYLGWVIWMEAAFLALPLIVAIIYGEPVFGNALLITMGICAFIGLALTYKKPKHKTLYLKEAMLITALSWVLLSLLGALPFYISQEIPHYIDAFFETASGFTTTGSTILPDVGKLSYSALFWRSFTHWIGGMGVIVFILALIPTREGSLIFLLKAESPGPSVSKIVPKIKDTAIKLYKVYFILTVILMVLLLFLGLPLFDALTISFGTAGTGGFGVRSDGFDSYSMLAQFVIAIFMVIFGINFNFYFLLAKKKFKQAFTMEEVLTFIVIILVITTLITGVVYSQFDSLVEAAHHVFFTVSSIISTTGFATVDFSKWAPFALTLIVLLMLLGACAGSTGGGFKVSRVMILFKGVKKEFHKLLHPRSVEKIRMDGKVVSHDVIRSVTIFFTLYVLIFIGAVILVSLDEFDLTSTFTSVAATLNNIGPALGQFGPMDNFAAYSDFSKLILTFCMIAGRLELLPLILLFIPSIWMKSTSKRAKPRPKKYKIRKEPEEKAA